MTSDLFPQPFTPFEYYYWCDDRPGYPTTFPIELMFRGMLQRSPFERAFGLVLGRHPLLQALVDRRSARVPRWVDAGGQSNPIDWADDSQPMQPSANAHLDLTKQPGLRVWIRTSSDRSRVTLQFHHACCDALGGLNFIEELLVAYDALIAETAWDARLSPLAPDKLAQRGDYGLRDAGYRLNLRDVLAMARIWSGTLLRRASVVATTENKPLSSEPVGDRGYLTERLPQEEIRRLRIAAVEAGATQNDLMLRDLFLVLHRWNAAQTCTKRQRLIVNVPVSLRTRADQGMPAANALGFWFLQRTETDCSEPDSLLASIEQETANVKKWRLPLFFIGGLGIAMRIPGLMRAMLARKQSFATAVFSNVGRVFARTPLNRSDGRLVCGGAILERVTGVPPIRPGTRIAIVIVAYADETTINLRCDPKFLSPTDAQRLLNEFREQLTTSAGVDSACDRNGERGMRNAE